VDLGGMELWTNYLLVALVVLLAVQQWRLFRFRRRLAQREELFRIVAENAADMIALVDAKGRRLYNSPAYERTLGYSPEALGKTSAFEQIHPDDRFAILEASREACRTGVGKNLQYRIRHRDGTWRIFESTSSPIRNAKGDVDKLVIVNRDVTTRVHAEQQLEHNLLHDPLTGLPNRRLFLERLQSAFGRAQRTLGVTYAALFLDIDGFKRVNDAVGQAMGDQILKEIAQRLASCLRQDEPAAAGSSESQLSSTTLARLGADEFALLLENLREPSDAMRVARRLQSVVAAPFPSQDRELVVSASIGIALNSALQTQPEELLHEADIAMRRAKALGGARCEVFDEAMHTRAEQRLQLEQELRAAFGNNDFRLLYQPIFHLPTRRVVGFEALVRWHHPKLGVISPYQFLNIADDTGLILSLGKWILREACHQLQTWHAAYPALPRLSVTVNLSGKQLLHPLFISDVRTSLHATTLEPSTLHLELPEAACMADPKLTADVLPRLKHLGIRLSLGDFGTGQSSLSWLRRFALDELKIDRSLIHTMPTDRSSADIIRLSLTVARELNLKVVAEGIETAVQQSRLADLGCTFGQGYLFSPPLDPQKADELLREQSLHLAFREESFPVL
jgi:diguanylate cyclase (GGDEF)-like protein/PAS domain S-box-containing protein